MTPKEYKKYVEVEAAIKKRRVQLLAEAWTPNGDKEIFKYLEDMAPFKLDQEDVPLRIKIVENPKYKISKLFGGAVDLFTHDCIHVLLGRGLLLKDEAFVIGYTMGSTKSTPRWKRNLFMFITKYVYPHGYKFYEEERYVFYSGVMAGSKCKTDLSAVDFSKHLDYKVSALRQKLGVEKELLDCYYCLERKCFPNSPESQRLPQA